MYVKSLPIANRHNLAAILLKAIQWVEKTGASFFVSSSCTDPVLVVFRSMRHSNCRIFITLDKEEGFLDFTVSNGHKIPCAIISKAMEFLDAINKVTSTSVELNPKYSEIRAAQAIRLTEDEITNDEIACAYDATCKATDDCTLPLLSMIYENKTVAEAIREYEVARGISIADWNAAKVHPSNVH